MIGLILLSLNSFSQANKFIGNWEGKLNVGVELRIVFHIIADGKGGVASVADSPDQDAYGLHCDTTIISGDEISIEMKDLKAYVNAKMTNDSTLEGNFKQLALIPLTLKRVLKPSERYRPQTPKAPFDYKSEEVEYSGKDKLLRYGATITIPKGKGPFPAAVLITGSGAQNRDEEILGHKPFAVLADYLTKKGFVVLRVDDRGIGKSTGRFGLATSADFAIDVNNSVNYLLSRSEVDKKKTGLIGHSEGGMIAPMVAAERKDISFIVLMAGPGVPIIDLMAEQNEAVARSGGVTEDALKEIKPLFKTLVTVIEQSKDSAAAFTNTAIALEGWAKDKPKPVLEELNLGTILQRSEYVTAMVSQLQSPWFKYFIKFDPGKYLEQLNCKVLAVDGDKDVQVVSKQNLPGIQASLKKSKTKIYEVKELPGLNHLFQHCIKCTVAEYGELEETISPAALEIIGNWLEKNVKATILK